MKKGSNFLIVILFILIIIPVIVLLAISDIVKYEISVRNTDPFILNLTSIIGALSTVAGIITIYMQINKEKRLNSSRFLMDLNEFFINHKDIEDVRYRLDAFDDNKNLGKAYFDKIFKTENDKYKINEYLNFFESVQNFLEKKVLKIKDVSEMFSKRFFMVVNNKFVQKYYLEEKNVFWAEIFKLHRSLVEYKNEKNIEIPYFKNDLSFLDCYNECSHGYYKEKHIKNNKIKILLFFSIPFLSVLFIIAYKIFNLSIINTSQITAAVATIFGGVAIYLQVQDENEINQAKFLFDLNRIFLDKQNLKKVLLKADYFEKTGKNIFKKSDSRDVFEYFVFFGNIFNLINNKIIKINDINYVFNSRFFKAINNPYIHEKFFSKNSEYFIEIYELYEDWSNYRRKNNQIVILEKFDFAKSCKKYFI